MTQENNMQAQEYTQDIMPCIPAVHPGFFPKLWEVADEVFATVAYLKPDEDLDVRLQVFPGETGWALRWGDPGYDTNHHGYWGAGTVEPDLTIDEAYAVAEDLISQAAAAYFQEQ
jgi:hypothetical protein